MLDSCVFAPSLGHAPARLPKFGLILKHNADGPVKFPVSVLFCVKTQVAVSVKLSWLLIPVISTRLKRKLILFQ